MALKNQAIANANPNSIANRAYIDALYKEAYGRYATDAEYNRFKSSTVKDAANVILGQNVSPFATSKPDVTNNPTPAVAETKPNTSNNQILDVASMGKYTPDQYSRDANGKVILNQGVTPVPGTTKTVTTTPKNTATPVATPVATTIPDGLKNDEYYNQLDETNKAIVDYYWGVLASGNTDKTAAFQQALDLASQQADPYWKEKINIIKDQLARDTGTLEADLASREKELMDRQNQINEDLNTNKSYLTTEQQAELARQSENYNVDLTTVRDNMAANGLSSSSIRNRAEQRLATNNADVIGSSARAYNKKISDLNTSATRQLATIAQQTADYQRAASEGKTTAVRNAEATLGSNELANTNYAPLLMGNISGSLLESKGADILNRTKALMTDNYNA